MKIGIVISYISKNPAGLERYAYELVHNLTALDHENEYYIYTKNGANLDGLNFLSNRPKVKVIKVFGGKFWKDFGLLFAPRSYVYIFTGPIGPLFFRPKRSIAIVYDFAYKVNRLGLKNFFSTLVIDLYSRRMFFLASKIVCISGETKRELKKYFRVNDEKIDVIYPGFNQICLLPEERLDIPEEPFFLFVGTIKERKNILNIIKGFNELVKNVNSDKQYNLLIAGKYSKDNNYYLSLVNFIVQNNLEARVKFLGHITDGELCYLYKKTLALIYPSLLEGFGLPILEAMDCGVPVITSNLSSLGEVAGDNALLVNPSSFSEIGQAMKVVTEGGPMMEELIKKGHENADRFSWQKMAEEFIHLIREVSAKKPPDDFAILRIIKFLITGVLVVVFNLWLLYLFTEILHIWYLVSSVVAYILAVALNFTLQKFWVFGNTPKGLLNNQMVWYGLVSIGYLLANTIFMYLLVDYLHWQYLIAQSIITFILSCLNYFINRNFIFHRQSAILT